MTTDFTYDALPGRVVFGPGARARLADESDALGVRRILLIAGEHEAALADEVSAVLGDRVVGRYTDVVQHVPEAKAEVARAMARDLDADATLTIGGGSATGFGKAVSLAVPIPQIALPTTYAGSEMTPIWGLSDGSRKWTGRDPAAQPRVVVYDPELTLSLPAAIAGPSGLNALAHSVEALYGPGTNPVISLLALESVRVLHHALPIVVERPDDLEGRTEALYGAYLAACTLAVAGTALHHKTCHVLGGMYGLDHGGMNAVVLPHALRYNQPAIPEQHGRLAGVLPGDPAEALFDLARAIGAPSSLADLGMPEAGVADAAPHVVEDAAANVRPPDVESVRSMLDDAFHGRRPPA
ncbi:MAG: maleylacetate reductase [Actinomycetota bacterium]